MKKLRNLSMRFLILAVLVGGLFFSYNQTVSAGPLCDMYYAGCMNGCGDPIDAICAYNCAVERQWCELIIE
jgi:hypothetical protein